LKKALIPLLLIATMVLAVTIASAQDFISNPGNINSANGWATTGVWQSDSGGSWTDYSVTASHQLTTGASGAFDYLVKFKIGDAANTVNIGLTAKNGNQYVIKYHDGSLWLNSDNLGAFSGVVTDDYNAHIYSDDGNVWTIEVGGNDLHVTTDRTVNSVPDSATLALTCVDPTAVSPIIYYVNFLSAGDAATPTPTATPTVTPTPTATPTVTPTPTDEPEVTPIPTETPAGPITHVSYDPAVVQNFYNNAYNKIYSPYDIITYNPDGTYTVTPGYPTADGTVAAATATYAVSGTVTTAADGKPIGGASVVLGDAIQKTDDFGAFRFDGVNKGASDIAVSADGFASKTQAVDINDNLQLSFALDPASADGSTVASAANETGNMTTTTNTTAPVTMPANNTTSPAPTQTKSPGFEAIVAALAIIAVAGLLLFANRKK
jgi:hypothetical protein